MSRLKPPKAISKHLGTAWVSKSFCLAFTVLLAGSASAQSSVIKWAKENVTSRIKAFGERRITFHFRDVEGDREAYNVTTDGGLGDQRVTDLGYLRLEGREVLGWLNFDANIQDARFIDPQAQRYRLWANKNGFSAEYGDIRATLPSENRFVQVSSNVTGLNLGYRKGPLRVGLIRTESRGEARTISIPGTNSAGPYYLQSNQIIRGSERIEVDGVLQVFGRDYTIDYDIGSVTFLNRLTLESKIIPPTSTIVATYESFNFSGSAGRIEGASVSYDFGNFGRVGVTGARQVTGAGGQLSTRLEKFQGFGPASTPYFLQFQPLLTEPFVVRVDGVLQVEGIDYRLDPENPSIFYFNRFMPASSNIDVLYTPKPTSTIQGDREVVGVDYTLPFGKRGEIRLQQATGRSTNTPTPSSGTATGASVRYGIGAWDFLANYRDVPADYVSIQATSFSRNERANDWRVNYRIDKSSTVAFGNTNTSILNFNGTNPATRTRFTRSYANYDVVKDPRIGLPLQFVVSRTNTDNNGTTNNQIDSYSLSTNKVFGQFITSLSAEQQTVTGSQKAEVQSLRLQTSYDPSKVWNFGLGTGINHIRSNGETGQGTDVQLSARYTPNDDLFVRLNHTESNSGGITSIPGLNTGYGAGYNGNGFSSGSGSSFITGATNGSITSLLFRWQPSERLALRANGSLYRSSGSVSSNARTRAVGFGMDYDLGGGHFMGGDIDLSTTEFSTSNNKSTATTMTGFINGQFGKLGYRGSGSILLSGGSSQFAQDNIAFDLSFDYRLAQRHNLVLSSSYGRVTGYLPQNQFDVSLIYQYQIWQNLALNVRYRFSDIVNRDPFVQSGAYRSNTLDFEFSFNFGR